ncbi:MAG: DUF3223 domain-containing protein [Pseudomonadota bacterium]
MTAKPVQLGAYRFPTRIACERHMRVIWASAELEKPLTDGVADFVMDLFKTHREYEKRTAGREIDYFFVGHNLGGSRCFYVRYTDGTNEDFSYKSCDLDRAA